MTKKMNLGLNERGYLDAISVVLLFLMTLFTGSQSAICQPRQISPTVPADQPNAIIISEHVIVKQSQRYIGWPSIVKAQNGDLIAVFSGDRDWHVCPWGKGFLIRSSDGGESWTEPEVVINTPLDDRDQGLVRMGDGTLVLSFFTSVAFDNPDVERYRGYKKHAEKVIPAVREQWLGTWIRVSTDNGHTWGPYLRTPTTTPHGPTALHDGRLLYVRPSVFESHDKGLTWERIAQIQRDPQTWNSRYAFLSEQHAVETADGRIVALSRYADGADIFLRQIESDDGGFTWSEPQQTGMAGYPAHLLRLENDWLLATYGRRIAPMGQRAAISKDSGRTWDTDNEILLSNAVPQNAGHLGYPSSVQLNDGSIWTVYYQVEDEADGEYPALMATHWRLKN